MSAKAQKIRVGLFAIGALVLFGGVLIVFGGMRFWEKSDHYRIVSDSSVIGLESGAEVFLNGIKVGAVKDIAIAPEDIRKVAIAIKVKQGTPIHTDTRAMLQYAGITGLKVIDLRDGTSSSPILPPGSQIAVGTGMLDKLEAQAQSIVDHTTNLMKRTGDVMQDAGAVMQQARAVMQRAGTLTDNLIAVTEPAKLAATNLAAMTGSLKAMVDENRQGLRQSLAAITQTATGASALLDGQVSLLFTNASDAVADLKKLINANDAPLRATMFDLRQASRNFKELSRDLRQRPSRLLFSNDPSERKSP